MLWIAQRSPQEGAVAHRKWAFCNVCLDPAGPGWLDFWIVLDSVGTVLVDSYHGSSYHGSVYHGPVYYALYDCHEGDFTPRREVAFVAIFIFHRKATPEHLTASKVSIPTWGVVPVYGSVSKTEIPTYRATAVSKVGFPT